jgi:hypothetical protein
MLSDEPCSEARSCPAHRSVRRTARNSSTSCAAPRSSTSCSSTASTRRRHAGSRCPLRQPPARPTPETIDDPQEVPALVGRTGGVPCRSRQVSAREARTRHPGGVVAGVSLAVTGVAQDGAFSPGDAPTATPLAATRRSVKPCGRRIFGETGVVRPGQRHRPTRRDPHRGRGQGRPRRRADLLPVHLPTPLPSYYHDVVVYRDGAWVRAGAGPVGPEPHGLYEDRVTMLVDDGSVKGFANQGGWITCHEDLRDPTCSPPRRRRRRGPPRARRDLRPDEQRKYMPSRATPDPAGGSSTAGTRSPREPRPLRERHERRLPRPVALALDRSEPIGYSDNQYVFETAKQPRDRCTAPTGSAQTRPPSCSTPR